MAQEQERFWGHVENCELGPEPCWRWTGTINDGKGYGRFARSRTLGRQRLVYAHCYAYELLIGPIPRGLDLHHGCEHKWCCNPFHLVPLTPKEHRARHAVTHCLHGHEYTEANTYVAPKGDRRCRACKRALDRRNRALTN